MTILFALLLQSESDLYRKCDSEIPWITDGTELLDAEQLGRRPQNYRVDRAAILDQAKKKAAEANRLILWYCPRIPGGHMNRAQVLDNYMKVVVFTDPGVVDLIRAQFVPLRMCCDPEVGKALGIRRFDFVEPGFLFLSPSGEVLHQLDRIRTFNADWIRAALIAVLRKHGRYEEDEKALETAGPEEKAVLYRRLGKWDAIDVPTQKGLSLVNRGRFEEARKLLDPIGSAESLYYLAVVDRWTGKDPEPRWRELVTKHSDTRWGWRAAANLVSGHDTLRDGPMEHGFEDFSWAPVLDPPTSTCVPSRDPDATVRSAIRFLLRAQRGDGSWDDARYVYCNGPEIFPNVVMAVTALAALALSEWRDVEPAIIDRALERAEKFLRDESRLNRGQNEECYAEAYRLLYFSRKKDVKTMDGIVEKLAGIQDRNGNWAHEYPNPFATAAVVHSLMVAQAAGAEVPDTLYRRAAEALTKTRAPDRRQAYATGRSPSSEKDSMARSAMCELALFECGKATLDDVSASVDLFWKHRDKLEAVRVCDFHADKELGGFFYFHGVFHTCEAARALEEPKRKAHLAKFRDQILAIPELDGSFVDSHELGKSYGTAMALLVLRRTE